MTDKEMANCNNCAHCAFCHSRTIAFEEGMISWESHLNKVEKLGCGYYKSIRELQRSEQQARKEVAEKILNEIDKELYDISRLYLERVAKNSKDDDLINNYGVMTIAHDVVVKIAKEQFGVEIKE